MKFVAVAVIIFLLAASSQALPPFQHLTVVSNALSWICPLFPPKEEGAFDSQDVVPSRGTIARIHKVPVIAKLMNSSAERIQPQYARRGIIEYEI